MITPDFLLGVADDVLVVYTELQNSIVKDMARRFVVLEASPSTLWQMKIYEESGGLFNDALREIAKSTGKTEKVIADAFKQAGYQSVGTWTDSAQQILKAGLSRTLATVKNLTGTTAFNVQQSYIRSANLAYLQVSSGAMSYQQALRQAVLSSAKDGVTVRYASGRGEMIDVALRRSVMTGVNQTAAQLSLMNASEIGTEFVEVSAHFGARPTHAEWQGQVYHIGGRVGGYDDFYDATGYGTGDGLCGWNCRHSFYPFLMGVSERAYSDEELEAEKTLP